MHLSLLGESRVSRIGGPAEPAFISSMYVVCNNQKQHIILFCFLVDLLVLPIGLENEP